MTLSEKLNYTTAIAVVVTKKNERSQHVAFVATDKCGNYNANAMFYTLLPKCDQRSSKNGNTLLVKSNINRVHDILREKVPTHITITIINAF